MNDISIVVGIVCAIVCIIGCCAVATLAFAAVELSKILGEMQVNNTYLHHISKKLDD